MLVGNNGFATFGIAPSPPSDTSSYTTADGSSIFSKTEDVVPTKGIHMPESIYHPTFNNYGRPSSFMSTPSTQSEENLVDHERIADMRNERRYRMLLTHKFNPSRECRHFLRFIPEYHFLILSSSHASSLESKPRSCRSSWLLV